MPELNSPDPGDGKTQYDAHRDSDGLITQRLALLAVFVVAVIAVLTFAYVL